MGPIKAALEPKPANFFDEVICNRQTDGQTHSLKPYTGVCGFFLQVKFAASLLALLAGG